jgi:hypothetical protein
VPVVYHATAVPFLPPPMPHRVVFSISDLTLPH